jgi:hypothetical protein
MEKPMKKLAFALQKPMKTIFKYKLETTGIQTISMPIGAGIVHTALQGENICIWAIVNDGNDLEMRIFHIFGTGHPITGGDLKYISTVHVGALVFHIFEENQ